LGGDNSEQPEGINFSVDTESGRTASASGKGFKQARTATPETKTVSSKPKKLTDKEAATVADNLLSVIETGAVMITGIQEAEFTDEEREEIGKPLAVVLKNMTPKAAARFDALSAPVSLAIASFFYFRRVSNLVASEAKPNVNRNNTASLGERANTSDSEEANQGLFK
jgi:hypothetical protein